MFFSRNLQDLEGMGAGQQRKIHPTFRWRAANLLAFTKFVGNGLLIKCMGQVDLPGAPPNIAPTQLSPPVLSHTSPGFLCPQGRKKRKKAKKIEKRKVTVHIYYPARRFA